MRDSKQKKGLVQAVRDFVLTGERIGPLYCEAGFPNLRRVCGGDAGELSADVVDHIQVAVGTVVVAKPKIRADRLGVRRVHLDETCEG